MLKQFQPSARVEAGVVEIINNKDNTVLLELVKFVQQRILVVLSNSAVNQIVELGQTLATRVVALDVITLHQHWHKALKIEMAKQNLCEGALTGALATSN